MNGRRRIIERRTTLRRATTLWVAIETSFLAFHNCRFLTLTSFLSTTLNTKGRLIGFRRLERPFFIIDDSKGKHPASPRKFIFVVLGEMYFNSFTLFLFNSQLRNT
jgi:hypothetical protein